MDYFSSVSKRTRRQTDLYIESLFKEIACGGSGGKSASGSCSSSTIKKKSRSRLDTRFNEEDETTGSGFVEKRKSKRRKTEAVVAGDDVIFLGEGMVEEQGKWVSLDSDVKSSSVGCGDGGGKRILPDGDEEKVIEIDDDQCGAAEELACSEDEVREKLIDEIIHIEDTDDFEEGQDEESDSFDDKRENFDNEKTHWNSTDERGVEMEPSPAAQKNSDSVQLIIIESDGDDVEHCESGSEFASDDLSSYTDSSSSEAEDSSDEDYRDDNTESSSSGDTSVSYCDDDDDNVEYENEATSFMERCRKPATKEHGQKVETESSGICRRNADTNDDDIVRDFQGKRKAAETVTSALDENWEDEVEDQVCTPSLAESKKFEEKRKHDVQDCSKDADERKEHLGKGMKGGKFVMNEGKAARFGCNAERSITHEHVETSVPNIPISENHPELKPSNKPHKDSKQRNNEDIDKEVGKKEGNFRSARNPAKPKECHIIDLLRDCIRRKHKNGEGGSYMFEEVEKDVVHGGDTEAPAVEETLPLMFSFAQKLQPVEKTESEKEMDMLWEEMQISLLFEQIGSQVNLLEQKLEYIRH